MGLLSLLLPFLPSAASPPPAAPDAASARSSDLLAKQHVVGGDAAADGAVIYPNGWTQSRDYPKVAVLEQDHYWAVGRRAWTRGRGGREVQVAWGVCVVCLLLYIFGKT